MADANTFYRQMISTIQQLISILDQNATISDRIASDSSLAAAAAAAANAAGRTDLSATDFNNAKSAIDQLMFTFNSGSPTQKSFLYKML